MSSRFEKNYSDSLIHIREESPTVMIIGDREPKPLIVGLLFFVAIVVFLLLGLPVIFINASWLLRIVLFLAIFLFIGLGFGFFIRSVALPRSILLNKDTGTMIVEKPVLLRKKSYEYALDQIQEIRCRYISKGVEIILSIAMIDGEEINIFEDFTIVSFGSWELAGVL